MSQKISHCACFSHETSLYVPQQVSDPGLDSVKYESRLLLNGLFDKYIGANCFIVLPTNFIIVSECFFAGGDEDWKSVFTIPNILREFNPRLIGTSAG